MKQQNKRIFGSIFYQGGRISIFFFLLQRLCSTYVCMRVLPRPRSPKMKASVFPDIFFSGCLIISASEDFLQERRGVLS